MSSPFIADASIMLAWCFLDEAPPSTKRLFEQAADLSILVPDFWQLEIASALYVAERTGRSDLSDRRIFSNSWRASKSNMMPKAFHEHSSICCHFRVRTG